MFEFLSKLKQASIKNLFFFVFLVTPFFIYSMQDKQPLQEQSTLDDTALYKMMDEVETDLQQQNYDPYEVVFDDELDQELEHNSTSTISGSQPITSLLDGDLDVKNGGIKCLFSSKDNISAYLIDLINATKKTIYVAMYDFRVTDVSRALIRAYARGVKVLFVCDKHSKNQPAIQLLLKYGIGVSFWKYDGRITIMHHKFALFDDDVLWTGSFNWTYNAKNNCENVIVIKNQKVYSKYLDEFNKLIKDSVPLQYSQNSQKPDTKNKKKRKRSVLLQR